MISNLRDMYVKISRELRFDGHFSFYSARYTSATISANKGADMRAVQANLTHASITTTEIYSQFRPAHLWWDEGAMRESLELLREVLHRYNIMISDIRIHAGQFLLTAEECDFSEWTSVQVGDYHLYVHPNLELTMASNDHVELLLLGYFFDYRYPERSNRDILGDLLACLSFEDLLVQTDEMSGRFVLIYKSSNALRLFHDACGQREVYYESSFRALGSQPKLIQKVVQGEQHNDVEAIAFYASQKFLRRKVFVGDTTHLRNIKHLRPNYYIDLHAHVVKRFFPVHRIKQLPTTESATHAVHMLKGYLASAAHRYQLRMGVTAGHDSRVLVLASLELDCNYQVGKNDEKDNDVDIAISQRLVSLHGRSISVVGPSRKMTSEDKIVQDLSIDFPNYRPLGSHKPGSLLVNGNVSEIARAYYGSFKNVSAVDLVFFDKYQENAFVKKVFQDWKESNKELFSHTGYHILDMFYWEERMGNWSAKNRTESALSNEVYSPFCSRKLLTILLSTSRKDRNRHMNKLYNTMIGIMSPAALKIPINPTRENRRIAMQMKIGLYPLMKYAGRIYRNLKQ